MGRKRYAELVSHVDMVPTVLELLNLPRPDNLHGRSYAGLLRGEDYTPRDAIYAEKTFHEIYDPMRAVRTPTHKLIVNFETGLRLDVPEDIRRSPLYPAMLDPILSTERPSVELYDLVNDPGERDNLAGQEGVAGLEQNLTEKLVTWMRDTGDPLLRGPVPSPHYRRTLDALPSENG